MLAPYSMALGPYSTALWIDSDTEDYFGHGDSGQRLAGYRLEEEEPEEPVDIVQVSKKAGMVFDFREADCWVKVAVDDVEGRIALADENGMILLSRYV